MEASEITVLTGPYLDREKSLQDYCIWMEDQVQMLRTVVASLIARRPELFIGEDLEHLAATGHLPRRNEYTPL